ncbi:MAG: hypothetical protein GX039_08180 [Clostridia bacterium]|nr:hypothetical protein [Clostridia bacterium]
MIEVLLAAALMVIIMTACLHISKISISWWQKGRDRIDAQQNARVAMMFLTGEIQAAREVVSGSNAEVLIIATLLGKQYRFELKDGNLRRAVKNPGSLTFEGYNLLAYGVKKLEFAYDRPALPQASRVVTIHLVCCDPEGREFPLTTAVALRLKLLNEE